MDYLAFDDPTDIISALLVQTPSNSMTLDTLCAGKEGDKSHKKIYNVFINAKFSMSIDVGAKLVLAFAFYLYL